jgi:hypothetical protein
MGFGNFKTVQEASVGWVDLVGWTELANSNQKVKNSIYFQGLLDFL